MENHLLLQRYRRDRRNLLDFILSSGLAGDVRPPPRDVDLDTLSVDYVVDRVKSGGALDLSEATKQYFDEYDFPIMMNSLPRNSYFLISRPESSGSPPQRVPPSVPVKKMSSSHFSYEFKEVDPFASFGGSQQISGCAPSTSPQGATDEYMPSLGLPPLKTDLSNDDIRETAYEVLLACVVFSGMIQIHPLEDKKKDRKSKFLTGRRAKKGGGASHAQFIVSHSELLDIIRVQMETSEVMDACMKQSLCQIHGRILQNHLDIPSISLELMGSIGRSDFLSEKSYLQWQKRQANILEELLCHNVISMDEQTEVKSSLLKLKNIKDFSAEINHLKYMETLIIIRRFASRLSVMPGKFGVLGETYYWTSGYHLNIKLYKRLLCCIFDILEECQIIEEADEVLRLLKLTWTTLGINQTLHDALYGWVLLQQKKSVDFKIVMRVALVVGIDIECGELKFNQNLDGIEVTSERLKHFVEKSIRAAFKRVMDSLKTRSKEELKHPLAVLAEELKLISDKEHTVFSPVLREWCPEAGTLSAVIIHQLYGAHLVGEVAGPVLLEWVNAQHQIFLEWTERAISIEVWEPLSSQQRQAPSIIEIFRIFEEGLKLELLRDERIKLGGLWCIHGSKYKGFESSPQQLNLHEILSSTNRGTGESWEAEERGWTTKKRAIDQFFDMNLPVDIPQLQSLLSGVVKSLEVYLLRAGGRLVSKDKLYPSTPTLTRYKETRNVFVKKRFTECASLEAKVADQLRELTAFKLCVRLNTLHYIQGQIDALQDSVRKRWMLVHPRIKFCLMNDQSLVTLREEPMLGELLGELFTIFDGIRRSANDTIESICDFIGVRVVFVDLRDSFLFSLYRGGVENARLDSRIQELDMVLDQICAIIVDTLRDPVALSICRASMEGYIWALLNGGPSRAFSNSDFPMMQEDLYALKSETLIEMLMRASEQISYNTDLKRSRFVDDADTLLRILCHKKDRDASKFLKRHYQLPKSSDYEDMPGKDANLNTPDHGSA
ncbi:hypothetical protein QJS10_CPA01g02426 [Acorus calamus]|uniref:Uncharacterized protein n=1 Tax=Acorus calamus TaxID=4465 RepID=A0AAV9FLT8_ACOCL|nr:hypothetical protein QJS10_CPA01g02426 [Acorus calamus]